MPGEFVLPLGAPADPQVRASRAGSPRRSVPVPPYRVGAGNRPRRDHAALTAGAADEALGDEALEQGEDVGDHQEVRIM